MSSLELDACLGLVASYHHGDQTFRTMLGALRDADLDVLDVDDQSAAKLTQV